MKAAAPACRAPHAAEGRRPGLLGEFETLVEEHQDRLVRYAFRRLCDVHDAEDVVQGVFVRYFPAWVRGKRVRSVRAYLFRCTANGCTDLLRRRRRGPQKEGGVLPEDLPSGRPGVPELAAASEELLRLDALLGRLPVRQAEVVRLRVLDELSFVEIAEVLGCRLATAKSRFRYGLQKLRAILAEQEGALP